MYFYIILFLSVFYLPMIYCDLKCTICQLIGSSHTLHNILEPQNPMIEFRLISLISASTLHLCLATPLVSIYESVVIVSVYTSQ